MIPTSENGRKRQESSGKHTVSRGNTSEIDGKWKQYSGPENQGIFRRIPAVSRRKETEFDQNTPEKSEDFRARNTASMKLLEFRGTDRFLAVLFDLGKITFFV